mgnify:FL=1
MPGEMTTAQHSKHLCFLNLNNAWHTHLFEDSYTLLYFGEEDYYYKSITKLLFVQHFDRHERK